jgi:hypothetical protein
VFPTETLEPPPGREAPPGIAPGFVGGGFLLFLQIRVKLFLSFEFITLVPRNKRDKKWFQLREARHRTLSVTPFGLPGTKAAYGNLVLRFLFPLFPSVLRNLLSHALVPCSCHVVVCPD